MLRTAVEGLSLLPEFLSCVEQAALVDAVEHRLKKRRYEPDHWDSVIVRYRETELLALDNEIALACVERARRHASSTVDRWLPPHAIDLHEDGHIYPHVDSIKFSGGIVAGLSLLASATMRLERDDEYMDMRLDPGSLYVLTGPARYEYKHSVFAMTGRRLSVILRDDVVT